MRRLLAATALVAVSSIGWADEADRWKAFNESLATEIKTHVKKYPNYVGVPTVVFKTEVEKKTGLAKSDLSSADQMSLGPEVKFTLKNILWDEKAEKASTFEIKPVVSFDTKKPLARAIVSGTVETNIIKQLNYFAATGAFLDKSPDGKKAAIALAKADTIAKAKVALTALLKAHKDEKYVKDSKIFTALYTKVLDQVENGKRDDAIEIDVKDFDLGDELKDLAFEGTKVERLYVKFMATKAEFEVAVLTENADTVKKFKPILAEVRDELLTLTKNPPGDAEKKLIADSANNLLKQNHDQLSVTAKEEKEEKKDEKETSDQSKPFARLLPFRLVTSLLPDGVFALVPYESAWTGVGEAETAL